MRTGSSIDAVRCEMGFVMTGPAIAELDLALPASPKMAHLVTYFMKMLSASNGTTFVSVQQQYQTAPACPLDATAAVRSASGGSQKLSLSNFTAPLLILAFFMALAVSTRLFRQRGHIANEVSKQADKVSKRVDKKRILDAMERSLRRSSPGASSRGHSDSAEVSV